jgi:hypothetical protein
MKTEDRTLPPLRTQDVIRNRETGKQYRADLATVEGWHFTDLENQKAVSFPHSLLFSGAFEIVRTADPSDFPSLRKNARVNALKGGRVAIHASTAAEATKVAQALQALGVNVRQYGAGLILHADGK